MVSDNAGRITTARSGRPFLSKLRHLGLSPEGSEEESRGFKQASGTDLHFPRILLPRYGARVRDRGIS